MARTKQTVRKTTGGKAPRKRLHKTTPTPAINGNVLETTQSTRTCYLSLCLGTVDVPSGAAKNKAPSPPSTTSQTGFTGIEIGTFKLPGGKSGEEMIVTIMTYLDIYSLLAFVNTSMLKQLSVAYGGNKYISNVCRNIILPIKVNYLTETCKSNFHKDCHPFIAACEKGQLEDVKLFIETGTVTDVNMKGIDSFGHDGKTGLMKAATYEHINVVQYLLSFPSIDVSIIRDKNGWNVLHYAARNNKKNTDTIKLLLNHPTCTADVINAEHWHEYTPFDMACSNDIRHLLKQHGGLSCGDL